MNLSFHAVSLLLNPNRSTNVLSVCVCVLSLFWSWNLAAWERIINQIPVSLTASHCYTLTVASQAVCAAYARRMPSLLCIAPTKYLTGWEGKTFSLHTPQRQWPFLLFVVFCKWQEVRFVVPRWKCSCVPGPFLGFGYFSVSNWFELKAVCFFPSFFHQDDAVIAESKVEESISEGTNIVTALISKEVGGEHNQKEHATPSY